MPKRKADESEGDYLKRKLRRIQRKIKKLSPTQDKQTESLSPTPPRESPVIENPTTPRGTDPEHPEELIDENCGLPEEFLLALGKEGQENEEKGRKIRPELVGRWETLMGTGLDKEQIQTILKKYPRPENFRTEAPKLNPEISATLSDLSLKRDSRIIVRQNLILKALSALGATLTDVLMGNIKSSSIIEQINDAAKICCIIFNEDSSSRKFFALSGANPTIKEAVRNEKPDEFLFGKDCADKIKAAQSIKKTGIQIKASEPSNNKTLTTKQTPHKKQGNWRGPPPHQQSLRGRGGHRQPPSTRKYQPPQRDHRRYQHRGRHNYRR